jgi:hypothetical protein
MPESDRTVREVILLYPGASLNRQSAAWGRARADCAIRRSSVRSLPGIRRALRGADLVLVDATDDYPQAIDAFSQALSQLGAGATTVYTERMHDDLELFVRLHGSLLLFGPLGGAEWESFFDSSPRGRGTKGPWRLVA